MRRRRRRPTPGRISSPTSSTIARSPTAPGVIALEAPYRAEDAAIVPITIRSELPAGSAREDRKDHARHRQQPRRPSRRCSPSATPARCNAISTRVRVDAYTNMHAVAETSDGKLYAVAKFVKASGGCSSPGLKNADDVAHRRRDAVPPLRRAGRRGDCGGADHDPPSEQFRPAARSDEQLLHSRLLHCTTSR